MSGKPEVIETIKITDWQDPDGMVKPILVEPQYPILIGLGPETMVVRGTPRYGGVWSSTKRWM